MFKINSTWLLIGALVLTAGTMKYLSWRVDTLKTDLQTMTQTAESNKKALNDLKTDVDNLKVVADAYKGNRATRDKSNQKMTEDSKRADVVAKKPKLVEKQINDSFNKLTQGFQEATK